MLEYLQSVTGFDERTVIMAMSETLAESAAERIIHAAERRFEKGQREGKRSTLLRQLCVRFGDLPEAAVTRVQAARSSELDEMAVRFAKALPLDEILAKG